MVCLMTCCLLLVYRLCIACVLPVYQVRRTWADSTFERGYAKEQTDYQCETCPSFCRLVSTRVSLWMCPGLGNGRVDMGG
jgi:hypothetical protein